MNKIASTHYLIISTFPPKECGIANYAGEQVRSFREKGHRVTKLAFDHESSVDFFADISTIKGLGRTLSILFFQRFDEVYLHFCPNITFPVPLAKGVQGMLIRHLQLIVFGAIAFFLKKNLTVICHERPLLSGRGIMNWVRRIIFARVQRMGFHSEAQREEYLSVFTHPMHRKNSFLIEHSAYMVPRFKGTQDEARIHLGLNTEETIFLCIGFLAGPDKGFVDPMLAMESIHDDSKRLYIVGSIWKKEKDAKDFYHAFRDEIVTRSQGARNVSVREGYVSDSDFDCWLIAADAVILPYRKIASSSVGARTRLLNRPLILRNLETLRSQFESYSNCTYFDDVSTLQVILHRFHRFSSKVNRVGNWK